MNYLISIYILVLIIAYCYSFSRRAKSNKIVEVYLSETEIKHGVTHKLKEVAGRIVISNENLNIIFDLANIKNKQFRKYYMSAKIMTGVFTVVVVLLYAVYRDLSFFKVFVILSVATIPIIYIPDKILINKGKKNVKQHANDLPLLIDAMCVCLKTGMTIEMAITYLENVIGDVSIPLKIYLSRVKRDVPLLGVSDALDNNFKLFESDSCEMFTMTLTQSIAFGTSIVPKLKRLTEDLRELQLLKTEESINKLSAKMSGPLIIFIMLPVVIIILAPSIMRAIS